MEVIFFNNGNTGCFDEKGEQIPELQQSWFRLYIKFLKKKGIKNIDKIGFTMPNGDNARYLSKDDNWEIRRP